MRTLPSIKAAPRKVDKGNKALRSRGLSNNLQHLSTRQHHKNFGGKRKMSKYKDPIRALNALYRRVSRSPNLRYFKTSRDDPYRFCWTTERVNGKFHTLVYRIRKDGTWILKKKLAFGKRRVAKARASKLMEKRKGENNMKCRKCGRKLENIKLKDGKIGYRCPNRCAMPI